MSSTSRSASMTGKTCLVTGATSGIGRATATALAAQGAEILVAGRNEQKAKETVAGIRAETGNTRVHYLLADFADLGQVRELARSCKKQTSRLDVLVNNAGAYFPTHQDTPYGVERTFVVNHLAPFLLTNLLLQTLQESAPARIVNVASDAHKGGTLDLDNLASGRGSFGFRAYARSKLANILFTYELARRLDGRQVAVNAVHPGGVATDLWKTNFPVVGPALKWVTGLFALTPEQGADTVIYLASSPEVDGISGKYFANREPIPSSDESYDEEVAGRLWRVSMSLTALDHTPGVPEA